MTGGWQRTQVWSSDDVGRSVVRVAHEILERNDDVNSVVIVGMQTGGAWMSRELVRVIGELRPGARVSHGLLDVSMYRDDIGFRPVVPVAPTEIPVDLTAMTVVLVDDVLFTGRTVRAALEALNEHGRPRCVQLAVLVDRGHRELPIRPDFVGKNLPTRLTDEVDAGSDGIVLSTCTEAT